jgi:tRNA(fMet)-specific endonuclease VapC
MAEFLLDTEVGAPAPSRRRFQVLPWRLLYGARLREDNPSIMAAVRAFLARISVHPWDEAATEAHARIPVGARRLRRSAGAFDIMIAAHAEALGAILVTNDVAVRNLKIEG